MPTTYRLPDGFTVTARGEADSDWNGFPVPILGSIEFGSLITHMVLTTDVGSYDAEYVEDGKVTAGYYCDGLQWEHLDD